MGRELSKVDRLVYDSDWQELEFQGKTDHVDASTNVLGIYVAISQGGVVQAGGAGPTAPAAAAPPAGGGLAFGVGVPGSRMPGMVDGVVENPIWETRIHETAFEVGKPATVSGVQISFSNEGSGSFQIQSWAQTLVIEEGELKSDDET